MKKKLLLLVTFVISFSASSQEIYFKTGKNFTLYHYKDAIQAVVNDFDAELGTVYELGYSSPFKGSDHFSYDLALTLNEFNSIVGVPNNSLRWKTEYAGIQGGLSYSLIKTERFAVSAQMGLNASVIVYGIAEVNAVLSDLKNQDEFEGLIVQSLLGLEAKVAASKEMYLSLGYKYLRSIDSDKGPEVFSIETNQILLGVHFSLD